MNCSVLPHYPCCWREKETYIVKKDRSSKFLVWLGAHDDYWMEECGNVCITSNLFNYLKSLKTYRRSYQTKYVLYVSLQPFKHTNCEYTVPAPRWGIKAKHSINHLRGVWRQGLALSIGPNCVGFTWRRRQNPVSETFCLEK
jgi:hypothetical protein